MKSAADVASNAGALPAKPGKARRQRAAGYAFNAGALPPVSSLHNVRICAYTLRNQTRAQSAWAAGHIAGATEKLQSGLCPQPLAYCPERGGLLPGPAESFPAFREG